MRNAEEHKKLLAQIAELEKNSVNYFDVEKEFFLIDSNNLAEVKTRFYGYSIQATGIYEEDNLTEDAVKNLDGRGCYVYVEVKDGQITIKQDLNGCWGIYLFRHGDYFALSNSFFRLLDHIKFRYPLTVNRDYCHYLMINGVCSNGYLKTAVNEIKLVERNAIISIDIETKELQIDLINYKECSVPLDSKEGIAILDRWMDLWSGILRGIAQRTKFIQADLSGGFDSRMSLVALLHSGIDLNKMRIYSIKSDQFVFPEDYAIASQIADHYGFKLNQPLPERKFLNYSLTDAWNSDLYHQQTIRNLPSVSSYQKGIEKLYYLKGLSGETMRGYLHKPPKKFVEDELRETNRYSSFLSRTLSDSAKNIFESGFRSIQEKYRINDEDSPYIPQYLYQEVRSRNHYGKESLGNYFKNIISLSPALDPEIRTLQLETSKCSDPQLLMVIIFSRYESDLLKIRFDKYHKPIDLENLAPYAQKINEQFPRRLVSDKDNRGGVFELQPRDLRAEKILAEGKNNPNIPGGLPQSCLKATFESSKTYGLFTKYFDEELYRYAASYYGNHDFGRDRPMYAIVGVAKVLEDVEISQRNQPPYRDMQRFLKEDFCLIHDDNNAKTISKFKNYFTARIDIQRKQLAGDFQILSISDDKATVWKPGWFNKDGIGYQIQSYVGKLEIVAKSDIDGQVRLLLLGLDIRRPEDTSKRMPYWIDYTKLTVNGKVILDKLTPVWHDKPYFYRMDTKAGEEIKIQVEWLPHRSDT